MTGNIALDVVIGLVFIYALYSLFVTTIVELLSSALSWRSKNLKTAIQRMLDDDGSDDDADGTGFSKEFYLQPLIRYLSVKETPLNRLLKRTNPSYLKARNFSMAVVQLLHKKSPTDEFGFDTLRDELENGACKDTQTAKYLLSLLNNSGGAMEKFRENLETWFDDTMERAAGWYKRKIMLTTLLTGVAVAWAFNADTLQIVKRLSKDPKAREQYVQLAGQLAKDSSFFRDSVERGKLQARMDTLRVLSDKSIEVLSITRDPAKGLFSVMKKGRLWFDTWDNVWGCLITALALSLGAPFWFDLLSRLVQLRSSLSTKRTDPEKGT